jgi:hypothetical protein
VTITVLIPTSAIPSRPATDVIDQTVASVRAHLPDAPILVMVDGPVADPGYAEYRRRVVERCERAWAPALPLLHASHLHQVRMTRHALDYVTTRHVLFDEHDTPLLDRPIPWADLATVIDTGAVDVVRLHHEASVLEPHRHLMLGDGPRDYDGVPMWPTVQWSQRPHLSSTGFYRTMLAGDWWAPRDGMIEDRMHSVVQSAWHDHGDAGWDQFRLAVYHPPGDIKRSDHLDGRDGADKVTFVR